MPLSKVRQKYSVDAHLLHVDHSRIENTRVRLSVDQSERAENDVDWCFLFHVDRKQVCSELRGAFLFHIPKHAQSYSSYYLPMQYTM